MKPATTTNATPSCSTTVSLCATEKSNPQLPPWFGPFALVAQCFFTSWATLPLLTFCPGPRCGTRYCSLDFFLVLIGLACSNEPSVRHFYRSILPHSSAFMAVWNRQSLPDSSTLSRWLSHFSEADLAWLRQWQACVTESLPIPFQKDSCLYDQKARPWFLFDMDGTKQTTLIRSICHDSKRPPAKRRRQKSCAPGYSGRKRADAIRNRLVIQNAHTKIWLGTRGQPGNGRCSQLLDWVASTIQNYAKHAGMEQTQLVVRGDGENGHFTHVQALQNENIGYLVRAVDYSLLSDPKVQAALAAGTSVSMKTDDSQVVREVFDVPELIWQQNGIQMLTRLVVTRTKKSVDYSVGKELDDWVYEMFATNLPCDGFGCEQIVALYLKRGGFEATLSEEDREQTTDVWIHDNPFAQEAWQIVNQLVWNIRLAIGSQWEKVEPRALVCSVNTIPVPACDNSLGGLSEQALAEPNAASKTTVGNCSQEQESPEKQETKTSEVQAIQRSSKSQTPHDSKVVHLPLVVDTNSSFSKDDFQRNEEGIVHCPAGYAMYRRRQLVGNGMAKEIWCLRGSLCDKCEYWQRCRDPKAKKGHHGRAIMLDTLSHPKEAKQGGKMEPCEKVLAQDRMKAKYLRQPEHAEVGNRTKASKSDLVWYDLAARQLRMRWVEILSGQKVEVSQSEPQARPAKEPALINTQTADERAKRRRTWMRCWQRNERTSAFEIRLYGVQPNIAQWLNFQAA